MRVAAALFMVFMLFSGWQTGYSLEKEADDTQPAYFWDFGQVTEGEVVEHTFVLKNDSAATLVIEKIHSSCGCTVPKIDNKEIPPGDNFDVQVKFNTRGYSGKKEQFVYIHTENQDNPLIKLTIQADIQKQAQSDNN